VDGKHVISYHRPMYRSRPKVPHHLHGRRSTKGEAR
jgi:hypothetical protein